MKKGTLISCVVLVVIGLMAFSYRNSEKETPLIKDTSLSVEINNEKPLRPFNEMSKNAFELKFNPRFIADSEPDLQFFYDYGPRFSEITKATIQSATLITDLFDAEDIQDIVSYGNVKLILIKNEQQSEIQLFSEGTTLTDEQRSLLTSLDYSDNFNLRVDCKRYNAGTNEINESFHSPHLTVVPEKLAVYLDGKEALIKYLADGSENEKALAEADKMRPAKLYFTVTKRGKISNVKINNHSGYEAFDAKMIELLKKLPGKWTPAENQDGEKVDEELVVSWGFAGC